MNLKRKSIIESAKLRRLSDNTTDESSEAKVDDVNTATKSDLLAAIQEKFPSKIFTHKQCLKLLPDFNHAQKIYALLRNLLADGKLMETKTGYKLALTEANMRPVSTEGFVRAFCAGKKLPITRTRLEIAVSHVVGETINVKNREQALATIRGAISEKKKVVASISPECPRCGTAMAAVTLAENRKAWFCTNDRVSLPR
jgi:ribosomal protein S27AE